MLKTLIPASKNRHIQLVINRIRKSKARLILIKLKNSTDAVPKLK